MTKKLGSMSDDELLARLAKLLQQSRRVESELVAHIAEVDERRLYAREAFPSMFAYCTEGLHMSEAEAYLRIRAARASRKHPVLLSMLGDGRLHLTGIAKLTPYLTEANRDRVLSRAAHKSKQKIEKLVAEIAPKPDVPATMRKLPERKDRTAPNPWPPAGPSPATALPQLRPDAVTFLHTPKPTAVPTPAPRPSVEPLSLAKYKIQFTASAELHDKLNRLRALMRSSVPDGDLAAIMEQVVTEKLERLEAKRFAKTKSPTKTFQQADTSPSSRHIPAPIKRAVCKRDGNRCTFVDERGRRCAGRDDLEFHHRDPFGRGGDHSLENLELMCPAHNNYLAELDYGKEAMGRYRRSGSYSREPAPTYVLRGTDPVVTAIPC